MWHGSIRFVKGQDEHIPWQSHWLCLRQKQKIPQGLVGNLIPDGWRECTREEDSDLGLQPAVKYLGN